MGRACTGCGAGGGARRRPGGGVPAGIPQLGELAAAGRVGGDWGQGRGQGKGKG